MTQPRWKVLWSSCRLTLPALSRARPSSTATDLLGPTAGGCRAEVGEKPDAVGAAAGEGPDAAEAAEGGNPTPAGPNEAEVGAVARQPDAAEVEAEVGAAANHPLAVEEGQARIWAAAVEEPSRAFSPPRGDQAGGTESTGRGGGISRQSANQ
jgi:hypothetical protein